MKALIAAILLAGIVTAQNPLAKSDSFAGTFQGDQVTLELKGSGGQYTGTLTVQGTRIPATVRANGANATGTFSVNGQTYSFTMTPLANGFLLASEGAEYRLERKVAAPPPPSPITSAPPSPIAPTAAKSNDSIVGYWRNATGYARFNADGTGMVDGSPGRYEIRGNQLFLIGAQGQVTLPFEVRGDVLTLSVNGEAVTLNRVREEAGAGGIRPELVGKWCWISVTQANQGARQSSQCFTLNQNGTYAYAGETDSYNPFGGATSQSGDSGTWTATETTLTANSRSGRTTVYTLEKRNHPKNTRDPMIVLNGQPYVTFYNKPAW